GLVLDSRTLVEFKDVELTIKVEMSAQPPIRIHLMSQGSVFGDVTKPATGLLFVGNDCRCSVFSRCRKPSSNAPPLRAVRVFKHLYGIGVEYDHASASAVFAAWVGRISAIRALSELLHPMQPDRRQTHPRPRPARGRVLWSPQVVP